MGGEMASEVLAHTPDQFGGVIVDPQELPTDVDEFAAVLQRSLATWRSEGRRLVWLDVPLAPRR